jgi:hypothetical protein
MAKRDTPPRGLQAGGRELWRSTVADYELTAHECGLLLQACRTADALDGLQTVLDADGLMDESPQGRRVHPALVELRQQRMTFARLVAALGLPTGITDDEPKQQRRSARGPQHRHRLMRRRPQTVDGIPAELVDPELWPRCKRFDGGEQPCSCWCAERRREWVDAGGTEPGEPFALYDQHPCNAPVDWSKI